MSDELLIRLKQQMYDDDCDGNLIQASIELIEKQQKTIENMAMLMRRLLTERDVNRRAKKYLIDNDLMGSALRDVSN